MLKSLWWYFRDEVRHRLVKILLSTDFIVSAIVGVFILYRGGDFFSKDLQVQAFTTFALTYAAIALGFCISGMALVIANPSPALAKKLATPDEEKPVEKTPVKVDPKLAASKKASAFENLLFVFSWTALSHWCLIVFASVFYLTWTPTMTISETLLGVGGKYMVAVGMFFTSYCLLRFGITVSTLAQFGRVYIENLKKQE